MTKPTFVLICSLLLTSCKETNDQLLDKGYNLNTQKQYEKAIEVFSEVIKRNKRLQLAYYNRGFAYLELKQYDKALADFNKVMSLQTKGNYIITYNDQLPYASEETKAQVPYNDALYKRAQVKYFMDSLKSSFTDFQRLVDDDYEEKSNCMTWQGVIYVVSGYKETGCEYFFKARQYATNDEDSNNAQELINTYCIQSTPNH